MRGRSQRQINWGSAMRDVRNDRAERAEVRQSATIPGGAAWRGKSKKTYIFKVKDRAEIPANAVVIAVIKNLNGTPGLVAAAAFDADATGFHLFRAFAFAAGANELLVHRLADTAGQRTQIAADLNEGAKYKFGDFQNQILVTDGNYDRKAIMDAATNLVRQRQATTGASYKACIGAAMKAAWAPAKDQRTAARG